MRLVLLLCLLILSAVGSGPAAAGTPCPGMDHRFRMPASELAAVIDGWLTGQAYSVLRDVPRPGQFRLSAWRRQERFEVTIRPQSALAATATAVHEGGAAGDDACRRLRDYIERYLNDEPTVPEGWRRSPPVIPRRVLDRVDTVVCIESRNERRTVQISGFVVDPDGLALCTAHDLDRRQALTVIHHSGNRAAGSIIRLDRRRDLALVAYAAHDAAYVDLSEGRNRLDAGEPVFAIGCPGDRIGVLSPGAVNGPPRRMGDQPLWQVEMEIHHGSSGSPVFDADGRLVAMVKGRHRGTATIGFLTPLETIIAFLREPDGDRAGGIPPDAGRLNGDAPDPTTDRPPEPIP